MSQVAMVHNKSAFKTESAKFNNLEWCKIHARSGILAQKYNFCDQRRKPVTLRLSVDAKSLRYENEDHMGAWLKNRCIKFSDCTGIMYGAHSYTFTSRRKEILRIAAARIAR